MSSNKRGSMSRKRPTQVELERECAELKKQNQQLQKRLRQTLKQLRSDQDIQLDMEALMDQEAEASFRDMLEGTKEEAHTEDFMVFRLPDGTMKKVRKKILTE